MWLSGGSGLVVTDPEVLLIRRGVPRSVRRIFILRTRPVVELGVMADALGHPSIEDHDVIDLAI